jgi:hypothetical protein
VGYALNQSLVATSGTYRGRLVFTVRGMGSGATGQVTIDVFLQVSSSFKMSLQGGRNPFQIYVRGADTSEKTADFINVSFSGNSGQTIRIYQNIDTVPQNETDEELNADVLQVEPVGQTEGLHMQGLNDFRPGRALIYSSEKSDDNFNIYFLVNAHEIQNQQAGTYTGKITYTVETGTNNQEFPINLRFDAPAVFSLNVTTPPEGVSFTHVLANSPPQDKEVLVTVVSNLHKPYQVLQDLETNMSNQEGKEFDSKYFTIQVQIPSEQKGQTDFTEFAPIKTGEYPVFTSDAAGSSATFKVDYRLQGYDQMSPGNFLAPVRLSLNQK